MQRIKAQAFQTRTRNSYQRLKDRKI